MSPSILYHHPCAVFIKRLLWWTIRKGWIQERFVIICVEAKHFLNNSLFSLFKTKMFEWRQYTRTGNEKNVCLMHNLQPVGYTSQRGFAYEADEKGLRACCSASGVRECGRTWAEFRTAWIYAQTVWKSCRLEDGNDLIFPLAPDYDPLPDWLLLFLVSFYHALMLWSPYHSNWNSIPQKPASPDLNSFSHLLELVLSRSGCEVDTGNQSVTAYPTCTYIAVWFSEV